MTNTQDKVDRDTNGVRDGVSSPSSVATIKGVISLGVVSDIIEIKKSATLGAIRAYWLCA